MKKLAALVITLGLVGSASAATFTANIVLPGGNTVAQNGSLPIEVHGVLDTDADNDGLVFVSVDVTVTSQPDAAGNPLDLGSAVSWGPPSDGSMAKFAQLLGYDAGYGGTPLNNGLVQSGGAENTIGNNPATGPMLPFPSEEFIDFGVAHSNQVILQGTITIPGTADLGTYTLILENVLANVLGNDQSVSSFGVYAVEAADSVAGPSVDIIVQDVCVASGFAEPAFGTSFSARAWDGFVDARRESNDGNAVNQGLDTITIEFTTAMRNAGGAPISAAAFSISDTAGTPPTIVDATSADNGLTVTLDLDAQITLQHWTTFSFDGENSCNSEAFSGSIDIGFLPCDVNQDGRCNPLDVT
ncbi:MAG: hypothetical protein V3W34_07265, partial [Phycisphaerae bacterium]